MGVLLLSALLIGACQDPPDPPRVTSTTGSTAPWVEWRGANDPVRGPVVIVRDRPGGPLDRLVADPDVTTFFNDRFHPLFEPLAPAETVATIAFFDGCGCPLVKPASPASPAELIDLANAVIVRADAKACQGRVFTRTCTRAPQIPGAE